MTRVQAVCFDLDGTLIDSDEAIVMSFFHACDQLGLPRPSRESIVTSIGYLLEDQIKRLLNYDAEEFARVYREYYGKICCEYTDLMPYAREILENLRAAGLRLGFATSKRRHYAEIILHHLGVLDFFDARVGGEDVPNPKPNPEPLYRVAEQLGVSPREMILVGDTRFDVLAARNAGTRCVCVTLGYESREALVSLKPERIFDSLREVCEYILGHLEGPPVSRAHAIESVTQK